MEKEPVVWIIDSQQWPRAYLRAELIARGFDAIGFEEVSHALAARRHAGYATPHIIVLELCGLSPKGSELSALAQTGIPIIVLGGAVELSQSWIEEIQSEATLQRPFTIGDVADLVEKSVRDKMEIPE